MAPQLSAELQEHRHRKLLRSAIEVFADKGFHDTSVDDIIERADIARGTFYRYFDSKRDCFGQALDYFFAQLMEVIRPLDISELTADQYRALFRNLSRMMLSNPGNRKFTRLILLEAPTLGPDFRAKIDSFFDSLVTLIAGYFKKASDKGRISRIDPVVAAHSSLGLAKEALLLWYRDDRTKPDIETVIENMLDFVFFGMLPRTN
jgi:AcrR family transcriptional regulator